MKRILYLLVPLLLLAVPAITQDARPAPFTEVESLRVQNVNLQVALLRREISDLKADLERARPGWVWNPDDGSWKHIDKPAEKGK